MNKTFTLIFLLTVTFFCGGCKKAIENAKEDAIVSAMTDGQWVITSYDENSSTYTSEYAGYKFQFFSNRTVDAIKNGLVETQGNWEGDINKETLWANFSNVGNPLLRLKGTWLVASNCWTFFILTQTTGTSSKRMRLDKL